MSQKSSKLICHHRFQFAPLKASQQQTPQICKPQAATATQNNRNYPINVNSPINEFVTSSSVDNPVAMTSSATIDDQQVRFITTYHYYDVIIRWRDAWESVTGDLYHESELGASGGELP